MAYQRVRLGSAALLVAQLSEGETNLYPRAVVRDQAGAQVSGSPFDLAHIANGLYSSSAFTPGTQGRFTATFSVYTDSGHTTLSDYPLISDVIDVEDEAESDTAPIEGKIDGDGFINGQLDGDIFITGVVDDSL